MADRHQVRLGAVQETPFIPLAARALPFFSTHQAAVIEDATARIAPGPADDSAEAGRPVRAKPA